MYGWRGGSSVEREADAPAVAHQKHQPDSEPHPFGLGGKVMCRECGVAPLGDYGDVQEWQRSDRHADHLERDGYSVEIIHY